jgi:hypothetical protein
MSAKQFWAIQGCINDKLLGISFNMVVHNLSYNFTRSHSSLQITYRLLNKVLPTRLPPYSQQTQLLIYGAIVTGKWTVEMPPGMITFSKLPSLLSIHPDIPIWNWLCLLLVPKLKRNRPERRESRTPRLGDYSPSDLMYYNTSLGLTIAPLRVSCLHPKTKNIIDPENLSFSMESSSLQYHHNKKARTPQSGSLPSSRNVSLNGKT